MDLGDDASHPPVSLELAAGGLSPAITTALTISTANRVTAFAPDNHSFSLTFTPATGMFSGKFTAAPHRVRFHSGILLPTADGAPAQGCGFFLRPGASLSDPMLSGSALITR